MRHEYDDEQIFESNKIAARTTGRDWISRFNLRDVRAILDALPEPEQQDEWEPSRVTHVRKGDRVRWTVPGSDDNESYEIVVAAVTRDEGWVIDSKTSSYYFKHGAVVDRIPAPVQHPDPAEHPIIMEQGGKGWVWNAQYEMYYQPHSTEYRFPEGFTEWFPAQIISDEPAEAPR